MRSNKQKQAVSQVTCRRFQIDAMTAGALTISLNPTGFSTRSLSISDAYQLFRVTGLRFRLHPHGSPAAAVLSDVMLGYSPDFLDTPPTTFATMGELGYVAFMGGPTVGALSRAQTCPSAWVTVPTSLLAGSLPWYKSVLGAPDSWDEVPGSLYACTDNISNASLFLAEIEVLYQFKGQVDPANTPELRFLATQRREKERLLRILSSDVTSAMDTAGGAKNPAGLPSKSIKR
jgi:hypothetical protein